MPQRKKSQDIAGGFRDVPGEKGVLGTVEQLARLQPPERAAAFRLLAGQRAKQAFEYFDVAHQLQLIEALDHQSARELVERMDPDDRARLLDLMSDKKAVQLLSELSPQEQRLTQILLSHPEETAGHIMNPEFLALAPSLIAAEALAAIRERGAGVATIDTLPVVNENQQLLGMVDLKDLVLAEPNRRVAELMNAEVPIARTSDDQEKVARLLQAGDWLSIPVVENDHRLAGIITFDDAMDVLEVEDSEDMARAGGSEPLRQPYFCVSLLRLARSRVAWLLLLSVAAVLTVQVLSAFESTLQEVVSLALFVPLLIGTGGNAGAQSATTIVRSMALDDVSPSDLVRVLSRESLVGVLLGAMLGVLGLAPVWMLFGRELGLVISLSLLAICTLASLVGAAMPLLARRFGVDPAVVSAPLVTTIVDASGLLLYFLIAHAVMGF